jgi:hypothetical protein
MYMKFTKREILLTPGDIFIAERKWLQLHIGTMARMYDPEPDKLRWAQRCWYRLRSLARSIGISKPLGLRITDSLRSVFRRHKKPMTFNQIRAKMQNFHPEILLGHLYRAQGEGYASSETTRNAQGRLITLWSCSKPGRFNPTGLEYISHILEAVEAKLGLERDPEGFVSSTLSGRAFAGDDFELAMLAIPPQDLRPQLPKSPQTPKMPPESPDLSLV